MKKILTLVLFFVLALSLAGCKDKEVEDDPLECPAGQHVDGDVCVDDELTCPDGQHVEGDLCVDDVVIPTCTETQLLVDGECIDDPVCETGTTISNHVCKLDGIVLAGLDAVEVDSGSTVDLLDGVTATGTDGVDYTSEITLQSDTCTIVDGKIINETPATCTVVYSAVVDGKLARESRTISFIVDPNAVITLFDMENQDFTDPDISGWVIEGSLVLTHDPAGYLSIDVSALGASPWSQNIGNINNIVLPGVEYVVSYTLRTDYPEGRDVTFFIEDVNNNYSKYFEEVGTLTDEFQTFTYSFTPTAYNDDTKLGIFLGNTSNPMLGTVIIDSIIIGEAGSVDLNPVISGVSDITLNVDDVFDPAAGVTASDNEDGDITSTIVIDGTVDVTTPGVYVLTYTVTDTAGNTVEVVREVKVEDKEYVLTDIIVNGMFDASPWGFWAADWNETSVTATFDGAQAIFDIANPGPDNWAIQLFQENLQLVNGTDYVVTFDAMSTVGRDIRVKLIDSSGAEVEGDVTLTETMGTYMVTFMAYPGLTGNVKLDFELGNVGTAPAASIVTFDNVMVEEYDGAAAIVDTNKVMDSVFEVLNTAGWATWSDVGITSSLVEMGGAALVTYDGTGDASWKVKLEQGGIVFVEGGTYRLIFDAKGDAARDFQVSFWDGGQGFESGALQLGTEMETFEFVFVYTSANAATLEFQLGNLSENNAGTMFYLDNVMIERGYDKEDFIYSPTEIITNGMFDASPWGFWAADWNETSVTATFDGAQAIFDIANPGPDNWAIQLFQENLQLVNGTDYVVTFDAMSTVGRDIRVKLIDSSGAELEADVTLTDTMDTYMVTFMAYAGLTGNVKLDFELGNVGTAPAASIVTFDNVMVEEYDGAAAIVDTNKVMDSVFEVLNTAGWGVWARDWDPVVGVSLAEMGGAALVTYDGYGDDVWQVKIEQLGLVLVPGMTYKLSFDAKGDLARDIEVGFWDGGAGQVAQFNITDEFATYEFEFVYAIGATSALEFKLGATPMAAGTMFYLDNVKIETKQLIEDLNFVATDIITNGMFDASSWGFWAADWNETSVTATFDGAQAIFDIANPGPDNWAIQLFQENLQLVNGTDYLVTFDAMSTVGRDIRVKLIDSSGAEFEADVTLTDTMATYTVPFAAFAGLTGNVKLDFELGNVGTAPAASVVTFDNVMVEEWDTVEQMVVADTNKVMDSVFEVLPSDGWGVWARDWDPVVTATLAIEWGEAVVSYDGYGDDVWQVKIEQTGLVFIPGETYKLTFKAKSDVARDIEVGFWDGGAGQVTMFDIDTEFGFYTWVFTYEIGANSALEFKLGATPMAAGTMFYLDNVVIEILED